MSGHKDSAKDLESFGFTLCHANFEIGKRMIGIGPTNKTTVPNDS